MKHTPSKRQDQRVLFGSKMRHISPKSRARDSSHRYTSPPIGAEDIAIDIEMEDLLGTPMLYSYFI